MSRPSFMLGLALSCALACGGSEDAARVPVPITVGRMPTPVMTTDLGYEIELTTARAALADLELTTGGEMHTAFAWPRRAWQGVQDWLLPAAHAHPGHAAGGEVVGELRGPLLIDWLAPDTALGTATVLPVRYQGANFTFRRATASELGPDDALVGHTYLLIGNARKGGRSVTFHFAIDIDAGARLIGAPFPFAVDAADPGVIGLRLLPIDPIDGRDTLFDQIDFHALAGPDAPVLVFAPGSAGHNLVVRKLRSHDHYDAIKP